MASPPPTSAPTTPATGDQQMEKTPTAAPATAVTPTMDVDFVSLNVEFIDDLECVIGDATPKRKMLKAKAGRKQYLPGQPRIHLDHPHRPRGSNSDKDHVLEYLDHCHNTSALEELLPLMRFLFVQTPSFAHIKPLHHQKSHAREIKVTENPGLHLVWYYEMIFIKPIPAYFYSQAFWDYVANADPKLRAACLGFMRSYYLLIQYEMDFHEALKMKLIPRKGDGHDPSYEEWCEFIKPFASVGDNKICRRYHYGELRLTRINRAAFLLKGKLAYFHIYPQWGSFLEHTLAPIVTIFAVCTVVLNSMQVGLAAIVIEPGTMTGTWPKFVSASLWFPVAVMIAIAVVLAIGLIGVTVMGILDFRSGMTVRKKKKKGDNSFGTWSHGLTW
jgi:hypothetical protein